MKFALDDAAVVGGHRRAPQGARGLKSAEMIGNQKKLKVAPRKGRVG